MRLLLWLAPVLAYFLLDFTVHRGDSRNDRGMERKTLVKRDGVELKVENKNIFYIANLEIGSQKEKVQVLVDTGSSDLWVPTTYCSGRTRYPYYGYEKGDLTKLRLLEYELESEEKKKPNQKREGEQNTAAASGIYYTYDPSLPLSYNSDISYAGFVTIHPLLRLQHPVTSYTPDYYDYSSEDYYSSSDYYDNYYSSSDYYDDYYSTMDDSDDYYSTIDDYSDNYYSTLDYESEYDYSWSSTLYQYSSTTRTSRSYTTSAYDSDDDSDDDDYYATKTSGTSNIHACTSHGTYNTDNSESFEERDDLPSFSVSYADGSYASGYYGSDDVIFANTTVKNFTFASCGDTDSNIGVFGIGLPALEASVVANNTKTYNNFPMHLKEQGFIQKSLYSIALGKNNALEGSVLFGAVDHSKYTGTLEKVKVINRWKGTGRNESPYLEIILDSITGKNLAVTRRTAVNLDTGSTLSHLPKAYVLRIGKHLRGNYIPELLTWMISCDHKNLDEHLTFDFSGVKIEVPVKDLVVDGLGGECYLGIFEQPTQPILGDSFLRNAYVVYDLENFEIALAPASDGSGSPDIEEVTGEIPLAAYAPRFNDTNISEVFKATSRYTYSYAQLTTTSYKNSISRATPDVTDASWKMESNAKFTYTGTITINGSSVTSYTVGGTKGLDTLAANDTPVLKPHGVLFAILGLLGFLTTLW